MNLDVTISDPDRKLDFRLALQCTCRRGHRPRHGWRDGGDPGEPAAIEIDRARCVEVVVRCGRGDVWEVPGRIPDRRTESKLGAWCLDKYADEVEQAVRDEVTRRHRAVAS
jgi:hypothetical protein